MLITNINTTKKKKKVSTIQKNFRYITYYNHDKKSHYTNKCLELLKKSKNYL